MNADNYFTDRQIKYYIDKYSQTVKLEEVVTSVTDFKLDKVIGIGSFG